MLSEKTTIPNLPAQPILSVVAFLLLALIFLSPKYLQAGPNSSIPLQSPLTLSNLLPLDITAFTEHYQIRQGLTILFQTTFAVNPKRLAIRIFRSENCLGMPASSSVQLNVCGPSQTARLIMGVLSSPVKLMKLSLQKSFNFSPYKVLFIVHMRSACLYNSLIRSFKVKMLLNLWQ